MALNQLTPAQLRQARLFVLEKTLDDGGFNTSDNGPLEFLITAIVRNAIPDFTTAQVLAYLDAKHEAQLLAEKAALQARIDAINAELNG